MIAIESMIMFRKNKTAQWLQTKSNEEKSALFKSCIRLGRQQRQIHSEREDKIREHRQELLKKKEEALICKRTKERQKKEALCHQISASGYWNSEAKVMTGLDGKSENKRRQLLEIQLRFRQHVLKQSHPDKSVYCLSRRGKKLASSEVSANLCKLIHATPCPTTEEILKVPSLLVGMEIRYRFEDEDGLTWYDGLVIGVADMEFEVIYSGEEGICEFDLLQDYMKGDLTIIH